MAEPTKVMRFVVLALSALTAVGPLVAADLADQAKRLAFKRTPQSAASARDLVELARPENAAQDAAFLAAVSWVGRAGVFNSDWELAEEYGREAFEGGRALARANGVDSSEDVATALGAGIEVIGQSLDAVGDRGGAVEFLRAQRKRYAGTSIETRIQKNLLLIDLEGQPMPPVATDRFIGAEMPIETEGKVALFHFWAHWCADCKRQKPILLELHQKYADQGLVIIGPTRLYGYVVSGKDATAEEEIAYMESDWQTRHGLPDWMPKPLANQNFINFGVSTTPTLVVVDREGIVRLYHPGRMTMEELEPVIQGLL